MDANYGAAVSGLAAVSHQQVWAAQPAGDAHPLEYLRDRLMNAEKLLLDMTSHAASKADQLVGPEPTAQGIEQGGPPPHPPGLLHQVDSAIGRVELAIGRLREQMIRLP